MADKCMKEANETPMSEAKSHSSGFLKKSVKQAQKMGKKGGKYGR